MTERHNATPLAANYGHWVTCTCGWQSKTHGRQVDALTEHAQHVKANKTDPTWTVNRWMR